MYVVFIDMHAGQGMKRNYCTSISFCHSLFKVSRHKACTKEYNMRSQQREAWLVDQLVLSLGLKKDELLCYRLIRLHAGLGIG